MARVVGTTLVVFLPVVIVLAAIQATAQIILPSPTDPASAQPSTYREAAPVSVERIRRMLDAAPDAGTSGLWLFDLREYIIVVGTLPERPLFADADVVGPAPYSAPNHAQMVAMMSSQQAKEALASDVLGYATAGLVGALVMPAVRALGRWFAFRGRRSQSTTLRGIFRDVSLRTSR